MPKKTPAQIKEADRKIQKKREKDDLFSNRFKEKTRLNTMLDQVLKSKEEVSL